MVVIMLLKKRKLFKREFYEKIFFSRVYKSSNKINAAFISLFPSAYNAIRIIKKDGYAKFAIKLQNLEAELMIYEVLSTMLKEGHDVLSIHDSLVVNNINSLKYAESLIQERFQTKYRMQVAFKSKKLNQALTAVGAGNEIALSGVDPNEKSKEISKTNFARFEFPDFINKSVTFEFFELKHQQFLNKISTNYEIDNFLHNSFLNRKDLSQTQKDCLKLYVKEFISATGVKGLAA